jgi:hypothetical protein
MVRITKRNELTRMKLAVDLHLSRFPRDVVRNKGFSLRTKKIVVPISPPCEPDPGSSQAHFRGFPIAQLLELRRGLAGLLSVMAPEPLPGS